MVKKVLKKCPRCRKTYVLGQNGISGLCDQCANIERDPNGYAWHPGETQQTYLNVSNGSTEAVSRESAFRRE